MVEKPRDDVAAYGDVNLRYLRAEPIILMRAWQKIIVHLPVPD